VFCVDFREKKTVIYLTQP